MDLNKPITEHPAYSSNDPHMKAKNHIGETMRKVVADVGDDVLNFPGKPPKDVIVLFFTDNTSMICSNPVIGTLTDSAGPLPSEWIGRSILINTKRYEIDGKTTFGWVAMTDPDQTNDPLPPLDKNPPVV